MRSICNFLDNNLMLLLSWIGMCFFCTDEHTTHDDTDSCQKLTRNCRIICQWCRPNEAPPAPSMFRPKAHLEANAKSNLPRPPDLYAILGLSGTYEERRGRQGHPYRSSLAGHTKVEDARLCSYPASALASYLAAHAIASFIYEKRPCIDSTFATVGRGIRSHTVEHTI